jgi:serine phosphatase RsbU (regulator of sigma subunit)
VEIGLSYAKIPLEHNDGVLLYTDGVDECGKNGRQMFNEQRLAGMVIVPAAMAVDGIIEEVLSFGAHDNASLGLALV